MGRALMHWLKKKKNNTSTRLDTETHFTCKRQIYYLFIDTVTNSVYTASNGRITVKNKLVRMWKEQCGLNWGKNTALASTDKRQQQKTPVRIKAECWTRFELGTSKCKLKVLLLEPPCSLTQLRLQKEHIKNFDGIPVQKHWDGRLMRQ